VEPLGRLVGRETLRGYRHPSASWPLAQGGGVRAIIGADEAEVSSRRRRSLRSDASATPTGPSRSVGPKRPEPWGGRQLCLPALSRILVSRQSWAASLAPRQRIPLGNALSPTRSASNGCGQRISPSAEAEFRRATNLPARTSRRKRRFDELERDARISRTRKRELEERLTHHQTWSVLDGNPGSSLNGNRHTGDPAQLRVDFIAPGAPVQPRLVSGAGGPTHCLVTVGV
jgi:hypothetical protein